MILSLGSSKTLSIQAQKGQLPMNWHQHLHVYVKTASPHLYNLHENMDKNYYIEEKKRNKA